MKKIYLCLHLLLMLYAVGGIFSKKASGAVFLSKEYVLCYGMILGVLAVYAIFWQQLLKKLPLTIAMANKSVTVIWGMLFGMLFFHEKITLSNLLGGLLIIVGICIVAVGDQKKTEDGEEEKCM